MLQFCNNQKSRRDAFMQKCFHFLMKRFLLKLENVLEVKPQLN